MAPLPAASACILAALAWPRRATAATSPNIVTSISPTSITQGIVTSITVYGGSTGQKATFAQSGQCGFFVPSDPLASPSAAILYNPTTVASFDLCVQDSGQIDSIAQSGITLTVVAATLNSVISAVSPTLVSAGLASTITLTAGSSLAGTLMSFADASGTGCSDVSNAPSVDASSGSVSFTPPAVATYIICFRAAGGTDSVQQTSPSLTVQAATSPTVFTAVLPTGVTATVPTNVTLTGSPSAGDLVDFAPQGWCYNTTPSLDATAAYLTITVPSQGLYDLCVTASGGTDSIKQTGIVLVVAPAPSVGSDPVAVYNGSRIDFSLPPGQYVQLLKAPDVTLYGMTFEGSGPWEQWFNRIVAVSPDGQRWVEAAIRPNLLSFNRSAQPQSSFESLEVTLGRGSLRRPQATSRLPGLEVPVPVSFLGAEVVFRKVRRHYSTTFTTIGRARRECMDFSGTDSHFFVCATPAREYFGSPDRHLAIKFAHLNLAFVEVSNIQSFEGLLPELWGVKPLSEETAGYIERGKSLKEEAPPPHQAEGEAKEPAADVHAPDFAKGLAWAGGADPEDLKRSCLGSNESAAAERNVTITV